MWLRFRSRCIARAYNALLALIGRLGLQTMDTYPARRQLQWLGHVWRMDWSRLPRKLLTARVPVEEMNKILAHLALLVGREALSTRPATAQKSLGRWGRTLPGPPPPRRRCAAPGWATPSPKPPKHFRLRREIEGSCSPRRTALRTPQKVPCPNFVRLGLGRSAPRCPSPPHASQTLAGVGLGRLLQLPCLALLLLLAFLPCPVPCCLRPADPLPRALPTPPERPRTHSRTGPHTRTYSRISTHSRISRQKSVRSQSGRPDSKQGSCCD
jgi:hypothetical protein